MYCLHRLCRILRPSSTLLRGLWLLQLEQYCSCAQFCQLNVTYKWRAVFSYKWIMLVLQIQGFVRLTRMISFHLFFVVTMSCENIIIIVHIYGFCLFHWLVEIVCQYYNSCIQYFLVYVFLYVGLQCRMKSGLSSRHNLGLWWENI